MGVNNLIATLIFHLLPPGLMDRIGNASYPKGDKAFRRFCMLSPELFEYYSRKKLFSMFRRSVRLVPAYSDFLRKNNIDHQQIRNAADVVRLVPCTSKENYIREYSILERCINGKVPKRGLFEESSGASGKSTLWIRSIEEEKHSISLTSASLRFLYGFRNEERYIALNCFLLGGWSGGLRFASRAGELAVVRNIGPDAAKAITFIKEMGSGYTYLIGGYPPFVTELLEFGRNLEDFSWKEYNINVFVGGEGFPEEWRDYVNSVLRPGALVYSDYGAIDLDVGISVETAFSVALRKLIRTNTELRKDLISGSRMPVFLGQYSNMQYFINEVAVTDDKKEFEVTVMNFKSSSPGIKYAIRDEGGVARYSDVISILKKHGYPVSRIKDEFNIKNVVPFPFIWLYGRSDGTVSVNGALISPDEIHRCFLSDPELVSAIHTFRFFVAPDDLNFIRLFVYPEARKNVKVTDLLVSKCTEALISGLQVSNECFRHGFENNPQTNRPVVKVFPFGSLPGGPEFSVKNNYKI